MQKSDKKIFTQIQINTHNAPFTDIDTQTQRYTDYHTHTNINTNTLTNQ